MKEKYLRFRLKHLEKKLKKEEQKLKKIEYFIAIGSTSCDWKLARSLKASIIYELEEKIAKIRVLGGKE